MLFISLCRDFRDSWEILVDKENICDGNTENSFNESPNSCLHISQKVDMKELETPLEIDNDINVERAQACAKELDDVSTSYLYPFSWHFSILQFLIFNQFLAKVEPRTAVTS